MLLCRLYSLQPINLNNFLVDEQGTHKVWTNLEQKLDSKRIIENGAALYPVYVLKSNYSHQLTTNGHGYRKYDRGRSNSPPAIRNQQTFSNYSDDSRRKKLHKQTEQFRKSFSSEHIYNNNHNYSNGNRLQEPTSFSLTSRSSTTSTGSSTKSGLWLREFRSAIPVLVNNNSKLKLRPSRHTIEALGGPLIAQEQFQSKEKIVSPSQLCSRTPPITQPLPPSSGSESSGYFTPPAEHHLPEPTNERFISSDYIDNANSIRNEEANFQVLSDTKSNDLEEEEEEVISDQFLIRENSGNSNASLLLLEQSELKTPSPQQITRHLLEKQPTTTSTSSCEDFQVNSCTKFNEQRNKSKSETNLKTTLPEINQRKNINSAPPLNDIMNIVPYSFSEISSKNSTKTCLPGSIDQEIIPTAIRKNKFIPNESPRRLMRRSNRTNSLKSSAHHGIELVPFPCSDKTQQSCNRPKDLLNECLNQMDSYDWELIIKGLQSLIRLANYHSEMLEPQIHQICVLLGKNIRNLRSQVARNACQATIELFINCKKNLEMEIEELAGPLLHRTADTNKFLRNDANKTLDMMILHMPIARSVTVIVNKGVTHQNCIVRSASIRLLYDLVKRLGFEKIFQLSKDIRDKILLTSANGLMEGSLEARKYSKSLLIELAKHQQFQKAILEAVPQHVIRHISKTLNSLK